MTDESKTTAAGWVTPPDPSISAEYWLTRREADAADGYRLPGLGDTRVRYWWNGRDAWVTGYYDGRQRREPTLGLLHSNNGWRLEGPAS